MTKIKKISAREVLDSRGNPTVEATVFLKNISFRSIVPSGASTGVHEAHELRDGGKRYSGKGVLKAVKNINKTISKAIIGMDCQNQTKLDMAMIELDRTPNKSRLGANAILAVSMAACQAGAFAQNKSLFSYINGLLGAAGKVQMPIPQMNVINSGAHVGVENDIQEHMILPIGFRKFKDALCAGTETYHVLKKMLKEKYGARATLLGDEGGFAPPIKSIEMRLELLLKAIKEAGYSGKIKLGLDCAASEFYNEKNDNYRIMDKTYSKGELVDFYKMLSRKFSIVTIEDGFSQDDFEGWSMLNKSLGDKIQLVGDDLLVTNFDRMEMAFEKKACNALLLKVNQIGTVSQSIAAAHYAIVNNWNVVVSHRSGESEDAFISDLCVGLGAVQSKFGAPARSERTAKYNQLLRIEEQLGNKAKFARMR